MDAAVTCEAGSAQRLGRRFHELARYWTAKWRSSLKPFVSATFVTVAQKYSKMCLKLRGPTPTTELIKIYRVGQVTA
jgi:hypothetical protein